MIFGSRPAPGVLETFGQRDPGAPQVAPHTESEEVDQHVADKYVLARTSLASRN